MPISSIAHAFPAQSIMPRAEAMPMRTPGVGPTSPLGPATEVAPGQQTGDSFGSLLGRMVEEVNSRQNVAAETVRALQSGGDVSLHQAVIAMEEASVSFQLMVEVRNKLLESYQELMRMQI
jgi:flagellar hook-basal body complex protein FliE